MAGGTKLWVPRPASKLYEVGGLDSETMREKFVREFGEATVQQAELSTILDLMMLTRMITPSEFIEVITKKLNRIDQRRRAMANLDEDRG